MSGWQALFLLEEPAVSLCTAEQLRKYPVSSSNQGWAGLVSRKLSMCLAVTRTFTGEDHGVRTQTDANHWFLIFESNQIPFFFFFSSSFCISGNLT